MVPGVKGYLVIPLIEELERLRISGHLREEELSASLQTEDLSLFDRKLISDDWYDLGSFSRLAAFSDDRFGHRRREDWIQLGRKRCRDLATSEEFRLQLMPLENWERTFGFFAMTLWSSFYNFLKWELDPGTRTGAYLFEISGAHKLPERERFRLQGFATRSAETVTRAAIHVSSERPTPGRIILNLIAETDR